MAEEPGDEPDDEHDGNGEDERDCGGKNTEERPIAPGVASRFAEMACEQSVVAAVGLPDDVEQVAKERNRADEHADADVGGHAQQGNVRDAAYPRGQRNNERENARKNIAKARNQADDAVDAEAEVGAWDAERFVEEVLELFEGRVAKEPRPAIPAVRPLNDAERHGFGSRVGRSVAGLFTPSCDAWPLVCWARSDRI